MNKKEIAQWFDIAYSCISAGDFAGATSAFEYIISNFDAYAAKIAEQRLRWYCVPLQGVFERIQKSSLPVNIHEILLELFHLSPQAADVDFQLTFQEIEKGLSRINSCVRVGEKCWIHKEAFDEMVLFSIYRIHNDSGLVTLNGLIDEKWAGLKNTAWGVPDYFTEKVFANILSKENIHVLAQGKCFISELGVTTAIEDLADFIRNSGRPTKLREYLERRFSPEPYINDLSLLFKRSLDARFVEVVNGYEYIVELLNLDNDSLENYFPQNPLPLSTSEILIKILFPESAIESPLTLKVLKVFKRELARNQNIRQVSEDLWLQTQLVQRLVTQAEDYLKTQDSPLRTENILHNIWNIPQDKKDRTAFVVDFFKSEFRKFNSFVDLGNDYWTHKEALYQLSKRIYEFLLTSNTSLSTEDLAQRLGVSSFPYTAILLKQIENILIRGEKVFGEKKGGTIYWQVNSPSRRYFDQCYQILLNNHLPLTQSELMAILPKDFHTEILQIDLVSDPRFSVFPENRWGLSQWTWINDLAYDYIAKTHRRYHANVLIGLVCQENRIKETEAIFIPDKDSRFVKDTLNRWGILYKLNDKEVDLLHNEVAKSFGGGSTLGNILNRVIHLPVDMTNAYEVLSKDDRFIFLDGKWFARQAAFYQLTEPDLNLIHEFLVSLPIEKLPLSIKILIRETISRDFRLTDASSKLRSDNRFEEYHDGFWVLNGFSPPAIARTPHLLSTGHGKSQRNTLAGDEDNQTLIELTERKKRLTNNPIPKPEKKKEYIVLSHLDILHGNLRISGLIKIIIDDNQNAVRFIDEEGFEFLGLIDDTKSILNIRPWLEKRSLSFGDKISIQTGPVSGQLLIQPYGERDQRVYQEAIQHQDIEKLIAEARLVNKSYHDLIIEVMETIETPLHREDIFQLVDYQRTASRSTIFEILSLVDCPYEELRYFVPNGKGYWSFDRMRKEAYDMKLQELEQQNTFLLSQVSQLTHQMESQIAPTQEAMKLDFVKQIQLLEEKVLRLETERDNIENAYKDLQQDFLDRDSRTAAQFSVQLAHFQDQKNTFAKSIALLNESKSTLETKINSLEEENNKLKTSLVEYQKREEGSKNSVHALESAIEKLQSENKILREQAAILSKDIEREQNQLRFTTEESKRAIEVFQNKLDLSANEQEDNRQRLIEYKKRLSHVDQVFSTPIGRLIARFLHLEIKK